MADDWLFVSYGSTASLEASNAAYGSKAQRITTTANDTGNARRVEHRNAQVEAGKYYIAAVDFSNDGTSAGSIRITDNTSQGVNASQVASTKKTMYVKIAPTASGTIYYRLYADIATGSLGWVQYDSARLYEVTAEEYAKIGMEWNDDEVARRYPYVDDVKHLQNPYVMAEGKNLIPPLTEWPAINANITIKGPYEAELNRTGAGQVSFVEIAALPNTVYTLSGALSSTGYNSISAYCYDSAGGLLQSNTMQLTGLKSFTSPAGTRKIRVEIASNANGVYTFSQMMLNVGSVAKSFVPRNPSYLFAETKLGEVGSTKDVLFKQDSAWKRRKAIEKDVLLDGNIMWAYSAHTFVGYKAFYITNHLGYGINAIMTKHDGKRIIGDALASSASKMSGADFFRGFSASTVVTVSNIDSGFNDTTVPVPDEVKAYFNGWKASALDANGKPTAWVSVVDGSAAPTQTLAYVAANKAANYTPYKLSYVMAAPVIEEVKADGDIIADGLTQIEVGSGVIVREKVIPQQHATSKLWFVNEKGLSTQITDNPLSQRTNRILSVYKFNADNSSSWDFGTDNANQNGLGFARSKTANLETTADYYVTYLVLDKHLLTINPIDVKAMYAKNIRSAHDDLVNQVGDLKTISSVNVQAIAELYKRVKAMGG